MGDHIYLSKQPFWEGPHLIRSTEKFSISLPKSQNSIWNKIVGVIRRLLADLPAYDSGYFKVEAGGNSYYMDHDFGSVPKRATIYYSNTKPELATDWVFHFSPYEIKGASLGGSGLVGLTLAHQIDGRRSLVFTRADYTSFEDTSAWVRVLLWR
jgi:hypothetical protein